jgi:lipoprotein NlpI
MSGYRISALAIIVFAIFASLAWADDAEEKIGRAIVTSKQGDHVAAIVLLDEVLQADPADSYALYLRGRENFQAGRIKASVADFNKHVELSPQYASRQWERGLSLYYAGQYAAGAKQFELYQTYHDQDVENSAWRYLCSAKVDGVEKARQNMLPIERDPRVPLMEVFDLYRGQKTVDDVFRAVKAGDPQGKTLATREFYAHLYVGLHYDSLGNEAKALEHLQLAAERADTVEYMGDVAKLHAKLLKEKLKQ